MTIRGVPRSLDRFSQCGIKVSFWGSGTLKIVIYVKNYPQKRCFRLDDYHPLWGGRLISGHNIVPGPKSKRDKSCKSGNNSSDRLAAFVHAVGTW